MAANFKDGCQLRHYLIHFLACLDLACKVSVKFACVTNVPPAPKKMTIVVLKKSRWQTFLEDGRKA